MIQGVQIYIIRYLCKFKYFLIIFHTLYKCILNHLFFLCTTLKYAECDCLFLHGKSQY